MRKLIVYINISILVHDILDDCEYDNSVRRQEKCQWNVIECYITEKYFVGLIFICFSNL